MAYGDADEVAGLVPRYANTIGEFDASTRPTLPQVTAYITQVSALLDAMLAQSGFETPVTQVDVVALLDLFVNQEVAAIVEGVNGSGRFGPSNKQSGGRGRFALMVDDVREFISMHAVGFERLGAAREHDALAGLAYRDTDEAGDEIHPIFQRKGFGNRFRTWDS